MIFLPVVERELRVAARRPATYWSRFTGALLAVGIASWIWFTIEGSQSSGHLAKSLFYPLSILGFIYCLFAGTNVTADSLSGEKREGTLGLLFLTDLKGYDVVFGKLAATSLNACYGLLAIFPVLAVPLLLGGLTLGEFWRTALVLMNTLFFSLSAGILISACSYHERKAMGAACALIVLCAIAGPVLGWLLAVRQAPTAVMSVFDMKFLLPSPVYSFFRAMDGPFSAQPRHFWWSIAMVHGLGWFFLVGASIAARRFWQDRPEGESRAAWAEWWRRVKFGGATTRRRFRTRLLDVNPFFWLASRQRVKPMAVLIFLAAVAAAWLWLFWKFRRDMLDPATYIPTAILLHTAIKFWVASEACRPLFHDRKNGALELLLSTPLSVDEILRGHFLALKRHFGLGVGIILLADFVMFLAGMRHNLLESSNGWLLLCAAGITMFIADLYTLAWVSMWLGLTSKRASAASGGAVLRILVLPWALFLGFLTATVFINLGQMQRIEDFALGVWFIIGMLNNLFFFTWARTHLRQEMRTVATQPFDLKKGFDTPVQRSSIDETPPPQPAATGVAGT